jgi:hypothetical protein
LQQLALAATQFVETLECFIELGDGLEILLGDPFKLVEIQPSPAPAAFCREMGASAVDEQIPHDLGCERQKMGPVRKVDARGANETNIRLVDQLCRVE